MSGVARLYFARTSGLAIIATMLVTLALAAGTASAAGLGVSPKNEQTLFKPFDAKPSPKAVKYKLKAEGKKKVRWRLQRYPKWLVPEATSGTAKKKKKKLRFKANATKIAKLDPGIYTKSVRFAYGPKKKGNVVRRNVTLIVEGDPEAGLDLFLSKCSGCHDLFQNKTGPYLSDVYGRVAGTANGFDYSQALVDYGKVWEERNLNDWLTNTQKLVKGANMYFKLKKSSDRMNVIAYLKSVSS